MSKSRSDVPEVLYSGSAKTSLDDLVPEATVVLPEGTFVARPTVVYRLSSDQLNELDALHRVDPNTRIVLGKWAARVAVAGGCGHIAKSDLEWTEAALTVNRTPGRFGRLLGRLPLVTIKSLA